MLALDFAYSCFIVFEDREETKKVVFKHGARVVPSRLKFGIGVAKKITKSILKASS